MKIMTQDIKFKVRKLLCLLIGSVFLILTTSMNEDTVSSINKCISEADAQCLSSFLNTTIEMNVLGNNGYYGKSQAETICNNWRAKSAGIYEYLVNQLWLTE